MTTRLELFLQGGLGNQLIQLAYAHSLHERTGVSVRINPVLLHPLWSRLRSISHRERCWPWASSIPELRGLARQGFGLLRLYHSRLNTGPFTDRCSDAELVHRIDASRQSAWNALLGYFQRHQAFDKAAQQFWSHFKQQLTLRHELTPFPRGQVAAHIRLGDYLWPENQCMFARYPLGQQLRDAQQWSRHLGGPKTIHLVTDDADHLKHLLADQVADSFVIHQGKSAEDDFLFLARHRHIVGSNSTFSLCSARLSAELWGEEQVLTIPPRWYVDQGLDDQLQSEWSRCSFISRVDQVVWA